jgi:hypothetical protein
MLSSSSATKLSISTSVIIGLACMEVPVDVASPVWRFALITGSEWPRSGAKNYIGPIFGSQDGRATGVPYSHGIDTNDLISWRFAYVGYQPWYSCCTT